MRWKLLATGLGAYVIALIATAPATLIDAVLQGTADGKVRLAEPKGTLWSGSGQLELLDAGRRRGIASRITWHVRPLALLHGNLVCEVGLDPASKPFPITISFSHIEFAGASLSLPAGVLSLAVPRLAPLGLTGGLTIQVANLSIARNGMEGSATLQWRSAGSAMTPVSPLGDYAVQFKAVGPSVHAEFSTLKGPLQIDGKGSWSRGAPPSFLGTARVPEQYREQLAPLLRLIAVERGAGRFDLSSNSPGFGQ